MPKSKSRATAGQPIRPRPTNPVIAGRVPPPLHKKIQRAAKKAGRTMSEELAWRADVYEHRLVAKDYTLGEADLMDRLTKATAGIEKLEMMLDAEALGRIVEAAVARALANREKLP
jgi:hypothetical protein